MAGISFSGVGSGLPVNEIIKATLDAEKAPLHRLENDKKFYQSQISALGQLKSRLSSMRDAMRDLEGLNKFQHLSATSSNDKLFTATADHLLGATNSNYQIEVLAEARNYREVTDAIDKTEKFSGTLTFAGLAADGGDVTLNVEGKTLDQIREAINKHDDLKDKVSANLVNVDGDKARLVFNSAKSGEEGRLNITNSLTNDEGGAALTKDTTLSSPALDEFDDETLLATSLDARIKVDGIEVTSSTNKFENVVSGVTIDVKTGASGQTETVGGLEVKRDDKKIKDNIDAFVKAYNDVIIHLNESKKGSLYGDNTIRSIEAEMRNMLYQPTEAADGGDSNKNFLTMIGIEVHTNKNYDPDNPDSQNGTLRVNSAKLTKALDEDFDQVAHILGASNRLDDSAQSGYAERFAKLADDLVRGGVGANGKSYKGLLEIRTEGLNNQVKRVNTRMDGINLRLESLEERLVRQFSAVDSMSAGFQSTGSFLMQQMAGLPGYTRN